MVIKSSSAPSSPTGSPVPKEDLHCQNRMNPLFGLHKTLIAGKVRVKYTETEMEFSRLKKLVPAISKKQSVSKLDVILEAIRYIDHLQDQLVEQIDGQQISTTLFMGKENKKSLFIKKRRRRNSE